MLLNKYIERSQEIAYKQDEAKRLDFKAFGQN